MRNYKRKTNRGTKTLAWMQQAAKLVVNEKKSLSQVARDFEISKTTLKRFIDRMKTNPEAPKFGYASPRKVFSTKQEKSLTDHLLTISEGSYTRKDIGRIAYDYAIKYNAVMPASWHKNKMAGQDWVSEFIKRNPSLSIKKAKVTNVAPVSSSRNGTVADFFNQLAEVMDRNMLTASSIWNATETSITTVTKASIVAAGGRFNISPTNSAERGSNVTLLLAVSASAQFVPPMFVFPHENYQDHFVRDSLPDCIGAGNGSGCISNDEFLIFMKHFIKHVRPSKDWPVLLILDSHFSYLSATTLELAKENCVVILLLPPQCSQKLQPLEVSVLVSFKRYLASAQDAWFRNNVGKTMTIYDIPGIVRTSLALALTPNNIMSGFEKTAIFPFNRDKFDDVDFRAMPTTLEAHSSEEANADLLIPRASTAFSAPQSTCFVSVPSQISSEDGSELERENIQLENADRNVTVVNTLEEEDLQEVEMKLVKLENKESPSSDDDFLRLVCEPYDESVTDGGWSPCMSKG